MASILRFRKLYYVEPVKCSSMGFQSFETAPKTKKNDGAIDPNGEIYMEKKKHQKERKNKEHTKEWRRLDCCCWVIGYMCTMWWILLFIFHSLPATLPGFQVPESPGATLKREGLTAGHPVVLVPGIVTGGLELWEGRPCAEDLFRKRLWGGSFTEIFKRPLCWLEHLSLHNETGLDPPGIRVRAVPGLVAADYFAHGYFVWAVLIENLAKIGYEGKNLHMAAYDWRLSFQNTEVRDQALSRLKSKIELMFISNGNKKVVVVPHSMGVLYFLHFMKWVEAPSPMGGGGGSGWCDKHIKAIMNIGPAFLGVPKAVSNIISAEGKDVAFVRAMAPGVLDSEILGLQTLEHMLRVGRTWDSIISLLPKGGETIWGNLDWSPEEDSEYDWAKKTSKSSKETESCFNNSDGKKGFPVREPVKYGRIVSFSKEASRLPSSRQSELDSSEIWREHDETSRENVHKLASTYTMHTIFDLLRLVAPKMMQRAGSRFSHGIADDLDDPKYEHYKYWSNPLETKLPSAPEMEIYCLYGVGIPTERSYVYKMSSSDKYRSIPFRIDIAANGKEDSNLRSGVYFVDGDESVPVMSAGFMCAKGWRGKTRFNPAGVRSIVREYSHKPPASLLEGRGLKSGAHVDIMGNVALIEDILRVAAGARAEDIGGDRIYSDIVKMSETINLQL